MKTYTLSDPEIHEIWTVKQDIGPELNTKMFMLLIRDCAGITLLRT